MNRKMWLVCILSIRSVQAAWGFSSDTLITSSRYCSADTVDVGETLVMSFGIQNGETYPLYGFFLSDQVPNEFTVLQSDVRVDGVDLGNYVYETGSSGDVYEENTPHRWVLETPPDFSETNPISPGGTAEIEYWVRCSEPGVYVFKNFSWSGAIVRETDTLWVFGHADDSLRVVVGGVGLDEDLRSEKLCFRLFTNYPNPFRTSTVIDYELSGPGHVSIRVYDSSGRIVRELFDGEQPPGVHHTLWDRNDLPSGVYVLRLETGRFAATRKAIVMQ